MKKKKRHGRFFSFSRILIKSNLTRSYAFTIFKLKDEGAHNIIYEARDSFVLTRNSVVLWVMPVLTDIFYLEREIIVKVVVVHFFFIFFLFWGNLYFERTGNKIKTEIYFFCNNFFTWNWKTETFNLEDTFSSSEDFFY